jgi:hypothetical protein
MEELIGAMIIEAVGAFLAAVIPALLAATAQVTVWYSVYRLARRGFAVPALFRFIRARWRQARGKSETWVAEYDRSA